MPLITVVFVLIAVGVLLWILNVKVTMMDATIKQIINVIIFIAVAIWLFKVFGLWAALSSVTV